MANVSAPWIELIVNVLEEHAKLNERDISVSEGREMAEKIMVQTQLRTLQEAKQRSTEDWNQRIDALCEASSEPKVHAVILLRLRDRLSKLRTPASPREAEPNYASLHSSWLTPKSKRSKKVLQLHLIYHSEQEPECAHDLLQSLQKSFVDKVGPNEARDRFEEPRIVAFNNSIQLQATAAAESDGSSYPDVPFVSIELHTMNILTQQVGTQQSEEELRSLAEKIRAVHSESCAMAFLLPLLAGSLPAAFSTNLHRQFEDDSSLFKPCLAPFHYLNGALVQSEENHTQLSRISDEIVKALAHDFITQHN